MGTTVARSEHTRAEHLLIVPAAHTAVLSARFQTEMYELFHRSWATRIGHMVGTPMILLGLFVALDGTTPNPWPALLVLGLVGFFGLAVDGLATAIALALGVGLVVAASALASAVGGAATAVGLSLMAIGCLVQTLSHSFEDVPPPHSGSTRFVPVREWLRGASLAQVLRSAGMVVGVFFWLELWATLRIWPLQILHLLMRFGHRRELRTAIDARMEEILAHPESTWRTPVERPATEDEVGPLPRVWRWIFLLELPLVFGTVVYWLLAPTHYLGSSLGGEAAIHEATPLLWAHAGVVFSMVGWLYARLLVRAKVHRPTFRLVQEALLVGDVWIVASLLAQLPREGAPNATALATVILAFVWGLVRVVYLTRSSVRRD